MTLKTNNGIVRWINDSLFTKIKANIPLVCVDLLVVYDERLLLMLRNNEPAKDLWFTLGGRVHKGETLESVVYRILQKETRLTPVHIEQKGAMSHFWSCTHTVTVF